MHNSNNSSPQVDLEVDSVVPSVKALVEIRNLYPRRKEERQVELTRRSASNPSMDLVHSNNNSNKRLKEV